MDPTMSDEKTLLDVILECITFSGRNEQDLVDDFERRCRRYKVIPLWGQLKNGLKELKKQGKIKIRIVQGHKLCAKTR
jgi:hypothetical protein